MGAIWFDRELEYIQRKRRTNEEKERKKKEERNDTEYMAMKALCVCVYVLDLLLLF